MRKAFSPDVGETNPELAYVKGVTEFYQSSNITQFQTDAANAKTAAENLKKALDDITAAEADAAIDLSTYQTALNNAKSAVTSTEKAKNTAYSLWQSIANGTSSDLFLKDGDEYSFEFTVWIQNERQEDDDAKETQAGLPPRKYYTLTERGAAYLEAVSREWENLVETVADLQAGSGAEREHAL